jgi:hypothetical protein
MTKGYSSLNVEIKAELDDSAYLELAASIL